MWPVGALCSVQPGGRGANCAGLWVDLSMLDDALTEERCRGEAALWRMVKVCGREEKKGREKLRLEAATRSVASCVRRAQHSSEHVDRCKKRGSVSAGGTAPVGEVSSTALGQLHPCSCIQFHVDVLLHRRPSQQDQNPEVPGHLIISRRLHHGN